jgi:hypothetical protein
MKDFCSRWPDDVAGVYYGSCCAAHDDAYRTPGNRHDRKKADDALRECMIRKGAPKWWCNVTWLGVRLFGWTPWHFNRSIFFQQ